MSRDPDNPDDDDEAVDDDARLFREMMGDVKPLAPDNRIAPSKKRPAPGRHSRDDSADHAQPHSSQRAFIQSEYVDHVRAEETLYFSRPGLQHKVTKRLKRGEIPVEDSLDLHGATIDEAARVVEEFIQHAQEQGFRCVIIVHGKGHRSEENKPVLKSQINHWLRQHNSVLAFCSAMPKDGGVGAMYVLLRRGEK